MLSTIAAHIAVIIAILAFNRASKAEDRAVKAEAAAAQPVSHVIELRHVRTSKPSQLSPLPVPKYFTQPEVPNDN